jgi:hypothetical protein
MQKPHSKKYNDLCVAGDPAVASFDAPRNPMRDLLLPGFTRARSSSAGTICISESPGTRSVNTKGRNNIDANQCRHDGCR